jgi:hypothetical protein
LNSDANEFNFSGIKHLLPRRSPYIPGKGSRKEGKETVRNLSRKFVRFSFTLDLTIAVALMARFNVNWT